MKPIFEYIISKSAKIYKITAENSEQLKNIVKQEIEKLGENCDLNHIDVSQIEYFSFTFRLTKFNGDISKWNMSNAKELRSVFCGAINFNCDLGNWDLSKCTCLNHAFAAAPKFEGKGLEKWDVSNVIDFNHAFSSCRSFNRDISNWQINQNVSDMSSMFERCEIFCQDLSSWQIPKYCYTEDMFKNCPIARKQKLKPKHYT